MNWLIYGANGYTGRLIAAAAAKKGMRPVLAGRSAASVQALGLALDLETRAFGLESASGLADGLAGVNLVLHCAGPFSATSAPMLQACLRSGLHYLDITGEIPVFAAAHARSDAARRADVVVIPGVGFDIVPTDCLAASLVNALPAATALTLAFESRGGPSRGTAKTAIESLADGGVVLRDGRLKRVPLAWKSRTIPFFNGAREAVTIPWGDVYTAHVSTGVPDIEVYMAMSPARIRQLRAIRMIQPLLGMSFVQSFLKHRVSSRLQGPSAQEREAGGTELWGEARSADGRTVSATMSAPDGYSLTVTAALGIVRHLLDHDVEGGFYTPSLLMGANYALELPDVVFRLNA